MASKNKSQIANLLACCCLLIATFFFSSLSPQSLSAQEISEVSPLGNQVCPDGRPPISVSTASCSIGSACRPDDLIKSPSCLTCPSCGDGCPTIGEECDDGNNDDTDNCRNCKLPVCGDGVIDPQLGETCENPGVAGCREDCTTCGDGIVNGNEECDPNAEQAPGVSCNPTCGIVACGNGVVESSAGETCDFGLNSGDEGFVPNCRRSEPGLCTYCGDGTTNGDEVCDGGTVTVEGPAGDYIQVACNDQCTGPVQFCGDNIRNGDEACDGTDTQNGTTCNSSCGLNPFCGDNITNGDEACDGTDTPEGTTCTACVIDPFCGDGVQNQANEQCDDGNKIDDDGCSAACQEEDPCANIPSPAEHGEQRISSRVNPDGSTGEVVDARTRICVKGEFDFTQGAGYDNGDGTYNEFQFFIGDVQGENGAGLTGDWGQGGFDPTVLDLRETIVNDNGETVPNLGWGDILGADRNPFLGADESALEVLLDLRYALEQNGFLLPDGCDISGRVRPALQASDLECSVGDWSFPEVIDFRGEEFEAKFIKDNAANVCYTCAWVRIIGCFAPETKLLMADGTEKLISEVASGDYVRNPVTGAAQEVDFVMQSNEEAGLTQIITSSGKVVKLTAKHPVLTVEGILLAEELAAGDIVEVDGGYESVVSAE